MKRAKTPSFKARINSEEGSSLGYFETKWEESFFASLF
jgi:hypothetical protein